MKGISSLGNVKDITTLRNVRSCTTLGKARDITILGNVRCITALEKMRVYLWVYCMHANLANQTPSSTNHLPKIFLETEKFP